LLKVEEENREKGSTASSEPPAPLTARRGASSLAEAAAALKFKLCCNAVLRISCES